MNDIQASKQQGLDCSQAELEKYIKQKPQRASLTILSITRHSDVAHETLTFFQQSESGKMEFFFGLLSLCFGSPTDQKIFLEVCYEKVDPWEFRNGIDGKLIDRLPSLYSMALSRIGDRTEDMASHCFIGPHTGLSVRRCNVECLTKTCPCAFLVECVLNRSNKKPRQKSKKSASIFEERISVIRTRKGLVDDVYNPIFRDIILFFPYASIFFTGTRTMLPFQSHGHTIRIRNSTQLYPCRFRGYDCVIRQVNQQQVDISGKF